MQKVWFTLSTLEYWISRKACSWAWSTMNRCIEKDKVRINFSKICCTVFFIIRRVPYLIWLTYFRDKTGSERHLGRGKCQLQQKLFCRSVYKRLRDNTAKETYLASDRGSENYLHQLIKLTRNLTRKNCYRRKLLYQKYFISCA